tara:strand:- start:2149 stop:3486 length:1338 start_codon:yes stop_codon:yes gene_type:complete
MGSIVKTIGKVIKKVGKALKKIAPVLLVAAAAYVGYGYMTGFQSGGWPQITEWGKSLMGNVSSGMPISEAAMSADPSILADAAPQAQTFPLSGPGSVAGTPLDVTTTPPLPGTETGLLGTQASSIPTDIDTAANIPIDGLPDMASDPEGMISSMGETGANVAEAGGLIGGTRIESLFDSMASEYDSTSLGSSISDYALSPVSPPAPTADTSYGGMVSDFFFPTAEAATPPGSWASQTLQGIDPITMEPGFGPGGANATIPQLQSATQSATIPASTWGADTLTSSGFGADRTLPGSVFDSHRGNVNWSGSNGIEDASSSIMAMGGKAWDFFKAAVKKDPGMAMWTAVEIVKFISAALDKSAEQESHASRHVMGFGPGNYADLKAKYGVLPTSTKSDFWKSADAGNQGRLTASSKVKTGTKPMGNTRISAINSSPGGIIGPTKQVQV